MQFTTSIVVLAIASAAGSASAAPVALPATGHESTALVVDTSVQPRGFMKVFSTVGDVLKASSNILGSGADVANKLDEVISF